MEHLLNSEDHKNIRNIGKMNHMNDGTRSLYESVMAPEVILALDDWKKYSECNCVLIGATAMSYYVKPRYTSDVDVLFSTKDDIPKEVYNFKKHRTSAFQHNKTHVEVEVITPELINVSPDFIKKIFDTAVIDLDSDIKIASPEGLVALKLGRFNFFDQGDIQNLKRYKTIDLSYFDLNDKLMNRFNSIPLE